jgi:hypothetical protein
VNYHLSRCELPDGFDNYTPTIISGVVLLLNSYLFECIGNRRLGTAKERGRNEIPAIIDKDIDDKKLKKIV